MKRLISLVLAFGLAVSGFAAANDVKVSQKNSADTAWTDSKFTPVANSLFGFNSSSKPANVTIGSGLSLVGNVLSSTGGGSGTVTSVSVTTTNGVSGSVATATTTPAITLTLGAITPSSVAATGALSGTTLGLTDVITQTTNGAAGNSYFTTFENTTAASGTGLILRRARGSLASPTAVLSGDRLGGVFGGGLTVAGSTYQNTGSIEFIATENWAVNNYGTNVQIYAAPTGNGGRTLAGTFTSTGLNSTAIGATTPSTGAFTTSTASTSYTSPIFLSNAADPADAGVIRLGNAELIAWEASPSGTDVTLTVNSSEQFVFSSDILSPSLATSLVTTSSSFALLNTTATTVNAFGAATTLNIGASATTILNFGGSTSAAEFRFLEPSGSGTNYSAFKARAQAANITYTLPAAVASAGQVLTDAAGNGTLSWTSAGSGTVTVVGAGSLTSTALVTGGGTTTLQTPSATATMDSSGNISTPGSITTGNAGSAAGYVALGQGTVPSAGTTNISIAAPSSVTSYIQVLPGAAATGFYLGTNSAGTVTVTQVASNGTGNVLLSAGTAAITIGKTLTVSNSLTLAGTDATTMTFPTTSATLARTDAANTFTGASATTSWTANTQTAGTNNTTLATTAYADVAARGTMLGTFASPNTAAGAITWVSPVYNVYTSAAAALRTYTLPAAASYTGQAVIINVVAGTNHVNIQPASGAQLVLAGVLLTANHYAQAATSAAGNYICFISDGTNWNSLGSSGTWADAASP